MMKLRLFTPGPTMVSPDTLLEMAYPLDHHRTAGFREMFKECTELLGYVFQTKAKPLILTGSGTAAMEGAILGCCKPDSLTLVCHSGKFGERWAKILKRFKLPHVEYTQEYGRGFKAAGVAEQFKKHANIKAVIFVHSETSTCALSDAEGIADVCRENGALSLVDGITSIGTIPFKMDAWGIDLGVTGSQKALMLPPGLGFAAVSERAWKVIESHEAPAFYNDLKAYRKTQADDDVPWTPNNQLVKGLRQTLRQIKAEGIENIWDRSALMARATRAACQALGLSLYAVDPADSVTGINVPAGVNDEQWRKSMRGKHGVHVAVGQGELKGKMIRINHMGYVDAVDTAGAIAAMEWTLAEQEYKFQIGSGAAAFVRAVAGIMDSR
ncbi:MAG TPA: alanine--glyoxylate aminotransferase family protein [Phycisphaerae bacterium]|nr:alanine--glyoxylate aminotransferase family protein [Phycisphaerae bacterium]